MSSIELSVQKDNNLYPIAVDLANVDGVISGVIRTNNNVGSKVSVISNVANTIVQNIIFPVNINSLEIQNMDGVENLKVSCDDGITYFTVLPFQSKSFDISATNIKIKTLNNTAEYELVYVY